MIAIVGYHSRQAVAILGQVVAMFSSRLSWDGELMAGGGYVRQMVAMLGRRLPHIRQAVAMFSTCLRCDLTWTASGCSSTERCLRSEGSTPRARPSDISSKVVLGSI